MSTKKVKNLEKLPCVFHVSNHPYKPPVSLGIYIPVSGGEGGGPHYHGLYKRLIKAKQL